MSPACHANVEFWILKNHNASAKCIEIIYHNNEQPKGSQKNVMNDHDRIDQAKLNKIHVTIWDISKTFCKNVSVALDDVICVWKFRCSEFGSIGFAIVIVSIVWRIFTFWWCWIIHCTSQQYFVVHLAHMHSVHVPQIINEVGGSEPGVSIGHKMRRCQEWPAARRIRHNCTSRWWE